MASINGSIAFYAYAIATAFTILIGVLYATRRQIMPYHLKALESTWEEIDRKYQFMLKMLLNGGGYFGISTGLFMLVLLLIPFREGQLWAGYSIGGIGLVGALPLTIIVYRVKTQTKGNPPLWIMVIIIALLIIGLISHALA